TNNRRERELRKLVLGRRNWLFVWEDDGAERTANILTIVASCVSHGLNPREYLFVVTNALLAGTDDVASLLPDCYETVEAQSCRSEPRAPLSASSSDHDSPELSRKWRFPVSASGLSAHTQNAALTQISQDTT